jgi:hypothetical protein
MGMVSIPPSAAVTEVWERIRAWPAADRRLLATRIIQSLDAEQLPPSTGQAPPKPTSSAAELIGLWADVEPKPTDDDIRRILEESILEKHWL